MIVTLDKDALDGRALELAYRYARCRCLMAAERDLALDAAGVRDAAEEALSALRDAQKIRSSLTGASNSVKTAHETLDAMVARVQASLDTRRVTRLGVLVSHLEKDRLGRSVKGRAPVAGAGRCVERPSKRRDRPASPVPVSDL